MDISLVCSPFHYRMPVSVTSRIGMGRRMKFAALYVGSTPKAGSNSPLPVLQLDNATEWTTEEQEYLRTLREAGL